MALELRVTNRPCGFCNDGNHEACSIATASVIPHAQSKDGIVWLCGCTKADICNTVRLRCTNCNNRTVEEVDPTIYQCKDVEACAATMAERRANSPTHQMIDEMRARAEMAKVENAEKAAKVAKTAAPKTGTCVCGCKGTTKGGKFLPGHDARFVSQTVATVSEKGFTKTNIDAGRKIIKDAGASETLIAKYDKAVNLAKERKDKADAAAKEKADAKAEKAKAATAK